MCEYATELWPLVVGMPKGSPTFPLGECSVCHDQATGNHYGAMTCEGCKGFFKRSLVKGAVYKCQLRDACEVATDNRIKCKACRFKRCKELGMSMSAIKMGRIPKSEKLHALLKTAAMTVNDVTPASQCTYGRGASSIPSSDLTGTANDHSPCTLPIHGIAGGKYSRSGSSDGIVSDRKSSQSSQSPGLRMLLDAGEASTTSFMALNLSSRQVKQERPHESSTNEAENDKPAFSAASFSIVNSLFAQQIRAMSHPVSVCDRATEEASMPILVQEQDCARSVHSPIVVDTRCSLTAFDSADDRDTNSIVVEQQSPIALHTTAVECVDASTGNQQTLSPTCDEVFDHDSAIVDDQLSLFLPLEAVSSSGCTTAHLTSQALLPVELQFSKSLEETIFSVSSAYLKMCGTTCRCIDVMSRRISAGEMDVDALPVSDESHHYLLEQVVISFDLLGNKLMAFIKGCPGLSALWTEDMLSLAKGTYFGIWLLLDSPLFHEGDTHMLLPDGRQHTRAWMSVFLPEDLVEQMHSYAHAQAAACLTVPELGLMCSLLLTLPHQNLSLASAASVARLNAFYARALSYEVHRGRVRPHDVLANIWRLLGTLQGLCNCHGAMVGSHTYSRSSQQQVE